MDSDSEPETDERTQITWAPNPYDEQVVGPDGETRAEVRQLILEGLTVLRDEVIEAQQDGRIDQMAAFKLRLELHREKCVLVGLGVSYHAGGF